MNKLDLIKNEINQILDINIIKAVFATENINNDDECSIDLYLYISQDEYKLIHNLVSNIIRKYNNLIFEKITKVNNYYKNSFYYQNAININIYYLFDFKIKIYNKIIPLYDPYNLTNDFKITPLPYTNMEFAKKIDEMSILLFNEYQSLLKNDKILSYNIAQKILNAFILLYRGFYDSLNAKKEFVDIDETLGREKYIDLINIIKLFRFDNYLNSIREIIKEIDIIINKLPVNVIALFNIDFYDFTKNLFMEFRG